jgi:hypothetical protein
MKNSNILESSENKNTTYQIYDRQKRHSKAFYRHRQQLSE